MRDDIQDGVGLLITAIMTLGCFTTVGALAAMLFI